MNKLIIKGHEHPAEKFLNKAVDYFIKQGYSVAIGNEIETEWYNFDLLRVEKDHPSRDVQDTFWIDDKRLLRTQTSTLQGRVTYDWKNKPPLKIVSPGRVFRNEATDMSHEAIFYQLEGFVIDYNVTMGNLISTIENFIVEIFGKIETKIYPHHYPFVEPGMDVSIKWKGKWLEVLGSGMIHPEVIKNMGYDPEKWQGFAFGMGIDRLALLDTGINDIRLLYHPDLRMIYQF